jgi:mono/diheme cytochrome c family protein
MFATYLSLFILIALFVLFAWLVTRAWRARNVFVKFGGVLLAGLLTVLLGVLSAAAIRGLVMANAPRNFPVADLQVQGTTEQVARGEEIARFLCAACHTQNGEPPVGGKNLADDIGMPLGDIYPPNLTPTGELSGWSDGEILRAIREGTHKNGRPLAMPVQNLKHLSDEDALAVIAYLRSQPAVQNQTPPLRPTLLTAVLVGRPVQYQR